MKRQNRIKAIVTGGGKWKPKPQLESQKGSDLWMWRICSSDSLSHCFCILYHPCLKFSSSRECKEPWQMIQKCLQIICRLALKPDGIQGTLFNNLTSWKLLHFHQERCASLCITNNQASATDNLSMISYCLSDTGNVSA